MCLRAIAFSGALVWSAALGVEARASRAGRPPHEGYQRAVEALFRDAAVDQSRQLRWPWRRRRQKNFPQDTVNLTLLTSLFLPRSDTNAHSRELFAALAVNLWNPYIGEVRLLMETPEQGGWGQPLSPGACEGLQLRARLQCLVQRSPGQKTCDEVPALLADATGEQATMMSKLSCVPVPRQPTYADFFRYAITALAQRNVLLANTDVVFDESLGLIEPGPLESGAIGHVLSVTPPPYASQYSKVLGRDCDSFPRCTIGEFNGWSLGGSSWDAFVLHPPFPRGMDLERLEHTMNLMGAENHAAYQLEQGAGVALSNPCMHVHAFHWHCLGGKMHGPQEQIAPAGDMVAGILPCWDCPGVRLPSSASSAPSLCARGTRQALTIGGLQRLFTSPLTVWLCCPAGSEPCDQEQLLEDWGRDRASLPLCFSADDVRCVVSEGEKSSHTIFSSWHGIL
mmetsp:Transcript_60325/g.187183  ORF Transcript_60325/g.187183 Transcript_60325/m.187183 type:complete len:453 (+) Transcript_60325:108-1466(+)